MARLDAAWPVGSESETHGDGGQRRKCPPAMDHAIGGWGGVQE